VQLVGFYYKNTRTLSCLSKTSECCITVYKLRAPTLRGNQDFWIFSMETVSFSPFWRLEFWRWLLEFWKIFAPVCYRSIYMPIISYCWHINGQNLTRDVKSSPITGLQWPRGFREVKVPRFHDNGTGWW
jgi:hypothetical protein